MITSVPFFTTMPDTLPSLAMRSSEATMASVPLPRLLLFLIFNGGRLVYFFEIVVDGEP